MPQIPIFGLGVVSRSPYVTAKLLTNVYVERRPVGEKSQLVGYQTPGLNLFCDFGDTPTRGALEFEEDSVFYAVHRGVLWEVNNAGVMTSRGMLATTTGRVSMTHNGVQVMIVDGTNGYIYNTSTTVFSTVASFLFANPTTVTYLARRFVCSFAGSSRFQWSDVDDGLTFPALSFANAETSPDPIVAVLASNGQLILLGDKTTEFWGLSQSADAPFTPLSGTASEWGLAARWSLAKYDNTYACLIKNRMGQVLVGKLNGYIPEPISTPDVDDIVNGYATTAAASSYSYMLGGHPMYVINFPAAGFTWIYDGSVPHWSKLKSYQITRHRVEFAFSFLSRTLGADYATGKIYDITDAAITDNGDPIERIVLGETIVNPDGELSIDKLRLDMEVGIGTTSGQGVNPQIGLRVSRDNGKTWGPQQWTGCGEMGNYTRRVEWRRLGTVGVPRAPAFTPEITITDPVPFVLVSACLNPET